MNNLSLKDILIDEDAYVWKIITDNDIKRRLLDIGLSKDTKVTPIFNSVSGGIRAYRIRNSLIAIRDVDATNILVRKKL